MIIALIGSIKESFQEPGTVLLISFSQVIEKETRTTRSRWRRITGQFSDPF
jgi:hypothetical protein